MAPKPEDKIKLLKQVQGLGYLASGAGTPAYQLSEYNENQLSGFVKDYRTLLNQNVEVDAPETDEEETLASFTEQPVVTQGSKDLLKDLIDRAVKGETLDTYQTGAVEAAMSVAGYTVTELNNEFSAEEREALPRFRQNLDTLTLEQIANSNFITAAEAERRAAAQAELAAQQKAEQEKLVLEQEMMKEKVAASLVYAGYLKPENAEDDKKIAIALKKMMVIETPTDQLVAEEKKLFTDFTSWKLTPAALEYVSNNTIGIMPQNANRTGFLLEEQLESGDPKLVSMAQARLAITNPDVKVTGVIDEATYNAGNTAMRAPLTMPADLLNADGSVRYDNLMEMAAKGQLYLPIDQLSREDRITAEQLPLAADREPGQAMSQEKFIALRLIADDPEKYKAILAAENTKRANFELDVTITKPVVAVDPASTVIEERKETNNPLGIQAPRDGFGGDLLSGSDINNDAEAVSNKSNELKFSDTETGLISFVSFLKESAPTGLVTMNDAMRGLHYASITEQEAFLTGATGAGGLAVPPQQHADRTATMLGLPADYKFDLNKPEDVQKLLTGLVGYTNRESLGRDFVEAVKKDATWGPSIERAAQGIQPAADPSVKPEDKPVVTPTQEQQLSSLSSNFRMQANGVTIGTGEQTPVADNTNRKLALASGIDSGPVGMG